MFTLSFWKKKGRQETSKEKGTKKNRGMPAPPEGREMRYRSTRTAGKKREKEVTPFDSGGEGSLPATGGGNLRGNPAPSRLQIEEKGKKKHRHS